METGREKFKRNKSVIVLLIKVLSLFGRSFNSFLLKSFRNTPTKFGLLMRYIFIKNIAKMCGDNVSIHQGVFLFNVQNLTFGSNISIHPMCYIDAAGEIAFGDNISMAHSSSILSTNHTWSDETIPIKYNIEETKKTVIEDDVWIGCGVRVIAGVTIGSRSVIAAGAVVNKDVSKNSLVGGVPAKLIKKI